MWSDTSRQKWETPISASICYLPYWFSTAPELSYAIWVTARKTSRTVAFQTTSGQMNTSVNTEHLQWPRSKTQMWRPTFPLNLSTHIIRIRGIEIYQISYVRKSTWRKLIKHLTENMPQVRLSAVARCEKFQSVQSSPGIWQTTALF
jgi:hypothetical protein